MKKFFVELFSRFGRVITELVSVKVVVMVVVTFLYVRVQDTVGLSGFVMTVLGWFLVVGLRFASKWEALVNGLKKG